MTMDKYMKSEERQGKKIFRKLWDPLRFGEQGKKISIIQVSQTDSLFKSFSTSLNAFKLFVIMRKAADGSIVKSQYVITF